MLPQITTDKFAMLKAAMQTNMYFFEDLVSFHTDSRDCKSLRSWHDITRYDDIYKQLCMSVDGFAAYINEEPEIPMNNNTNTNNPSDSSEDGPPSYPKPRLPDKHAGFEHVGPVPRSDQHRNEAVLHSLFREWSSAGADERLTCFMPIVHALMEHVPAGGRVLVPGCGLARLPVEIAACGYVCEANEFSAYMVMYMCMCTCVLLYIYS